MKQLPKHDSLGRSIPLGLSARRELRKSKAKAKVLKHAKKTETLITINNPKSFSAFRREVARLLGFVVEELKVLWAKPRACYCNWCEVCDNAPNYADEIMHLQHIQRRLRETSYEAGEIADAAFYAREEYLSIEADTDALHAWCHIWGMIHDMVVNCAGNHLSRSSYKLLLNLSDRFTL